MLDLGWQEFVMVGLVLVLVVGPKDMPRVLKAVVKSVGKDLKAVVKSVGKVRGMAREFQTSMMEVADQDEFKDVKKALNDVRTGNADALAEFEKVKESVNTSYVPGFTSDVQDLKDEANALKAEAEQITAPAKTNKTAQKAPKKKTATKAAKKPATKTAAKNTAKKSATKVKSTS